MENGFYNWKNALIAIAISLIPSSLLGILAANYLDNPSSSIDFEIRKYMLNDWFYIFSMVMGALIALGVIFCIVFCSIAAIQRHKQKSTLQGFRDKMQKACNEARQYLS